jgi:beta-N-acetylhexosaminidase
MRVEFFVLGLILVASPKPGLSHEKPGHNTPASLAASDRKWAETTLKRLTLEEKVGQMLQVRYHGDYKSFEQGDYPQLRDELRKYHIGSLVYSMHVAKSGAWIRVSARDAARVANRLQRDSQIPLLLAADLERGVSPRLTDAPDFPWPMAFGAIGDPNEVERLGAITAREARAVGIQWVLAPVADVNSNPSNPVINTRSFGENPAQVSAMVEAFIRGAHEERVLVTAKHFPGQGESVVDSHHGVAVVESDLARLEKFEFPPFKAAIAAGVDSILLAHARVPALDPDADKVTTTSPKVVTGVLRGQFGFDGVVLSDALEMSGITSLYNPEQGSPTGRAAVDAVKAGCDVIMVLTHLDSAFQAIVEAVRRGEIPESRVDDSVRKILQMKAAVGLNRSRFVDENQATALTHKPADMAFAQQIADEAVTLVRDNVKLLPLWKPGPAHPAAGGVGVGEQTKHGLVVVQLAEAFESTSGVALEKALRTRRPDAQVFYVNNGNADAEGTTVLTAVNDADQVVVGTFVGFSAARQVPANGRIVTSFGLRGPSGQLLYQLLAIAAEKTAVVTLGSPYLIENFPQIQNYVCTYAMTSTSELSAVKALFGEIQNHAKLPVTLPGIASRGFFLPWPVRVRVREASTTGSSGLQR